MTDGRRKGPIDLLRLKTLLHSGLPAWLPTPLRTQAIRSDQPPRILWPTLVRSRSPGWIRTNNLRIQSPSQLPNCATGDRAGAGTSPGVRSYPNVPTTGFEPAISNLRGWRAFQTAPRGLGVGLRASYARTISVMPSHLTLFESRRPTYPFNWVFALLERTHQQRHLHAVRTRNRTRTCNLLILSQTPLPIGLLGLPPRDLIRSARATISCPPT